MKSITKFGALLAAIVCIGSTAAMQPAQAADYHFDRHERPRFEHRVWRHNFVSNEGAYYNASYPVVNYPVVNYPVVNYPVVNGNVCGY